MKNICMCHMLLYVLLAAGAAWAVTVEKGVEITLEAATPEEGKAFHHWAGTGAPAGEAAFQSSWTYVPTASGEVEAVYGNLVTVADGGDLAAAVTAAGDYGVVRAGAGTYTISAQLALGSVRLEGNGRDGAGASVLTQSGSGFRALYLNNRYAYVSGMLVREFQAGSSDGFGAYIDSKGGTVVDCRLTGGYSGTAHKAGGGVYCKSADGLIARCIIDNNKLGYGSIKSNNGGAGVYMSSGALENCLVYGNYSSHEGGGIMMTGGTVRNCTVVDNFCQGAAGLYYNASSKVYNTAIFGNIAWFGPSDGGCEWYSVTVANSNNFVSCASSLPIGATGLVCEPGFNAPGGGDYAPQAGSRLVNAGGDAGAYLSLPLDLNRNSRVSGVTIDIGCYEYNESAETLGFRIEPREALVGDSVRFIPVGRGGLSVGACAWTVTDADGATVASFTDGEPVQTFATPGCYTVSLSTGGMSLTSPVALLIGARTNIVSTLTSAAVQTAVDAAVEGAVIVLEDGTYNITAPVTVYKAVKLVSRNGAEKCIFKVPSNLKERPLIMSAPGAELVGVTLTGGHDTKYQIIGSIIGAGGGLVDHCIVSNNYDAAYHLWGAGLAICGKTAVVRNTLIANNKLSQSKTCYGGGVYMAAGTIENCLIRDNMAYQYGGGVYLATTDGSIINCTFVGNKAYGPNQLPNYGGALYRPAGLGNGRIVNCAFAYSSADLDTTEGAPDWYCADAASKGAFVNCAMSTLAPNATCFVPENGDFKFLDPDKGDYRLNSLSPLVNAGDDSYVTPVLVKDFGGENDRILGDHVDIGCYEADVTAFVCDFDVSPRAALDGGNITFTASTVGAPDDAVYSWSVREGDQPVEISADSGSAVTNRFAPGWHTVALTVSFGGTDYPSVKTNVLHVGARTNYVVAAWSEGHVPSIPYNTWATAATNVFDAVDESIDGAVVMLDDGAYVTEKELLVEKAITLTSKNGAEVTTIRGRTNNHRILKINNADAVVERLTISNGAVYNPGVGGCGVLIAGLGGTLQDCTVSGNGPTGQHTEGAGITIQGLSGLVDRCRIIGNVTPADGTCCGAGVFLLGGTLRNSLVAFNHGLTGAGIYVEQNKSAVIENCTVVSNTVTKTDKWNPIKKGAGLVICGAATVRNTVVYGNLDTKGTLDCTAENDIAIYAPKDKESSVSNSVTFVNCALPVALGENAVTNTPKFVKFDPGSGRFDFQLRSASPCRNAGAELDWMAGALDVAGNPRIFNGAPDIGAYETLRMPGGIIVVR